MTFSNLRSPHRTIKRLVVTTVVSLYALEAAQAADLPVKSKAIEYVKVCALYGAGFYYIPGTDTCIKLGGYLRADLVLNSNSDFDPAANSVAGARNRLSNWERTRGRAGTELRT